MPKSAAHPYVPLTCNLCPKQPKFSDVSHLLTHVSSKSHLSCKFDLSIKAQADPAIGHQLAAYDHWFETYGIARLLADRMASKENKKNGIKTKKPTKAQSNRRNAEVSSFRRESCEKEIAGSRLTLSCSPEMKRTSTQPYLANKAAKFIGHLCLLCNLSCSTMPCSAR